ncbi:MAG: 8-amino-7-oxononanoate synthase [Flavobacteriales bacterium]|nr:8-amino-7-oxononanoate synthase [Flavobacteriales bacterium]
MNQFPEKLEKKLQQRRESNTFRELIQAKGVDFFSNDYLGASQIQNGSDHFHGSTGSRLISGNTAFTEKLEQEIASFFGKPAALLFNSGYDANLGLISSLAQRNDTVLYDSLSHASVRDGIQLSLAKSYSFRHNDVAHLKERLEKAEGTVYVMVESIYSMDGDQAPLKEIAGLCQQYKAYLIVDEAHSGGVYGEKGRGLVNELNLDDQVFAKVMTYGKAYGSHGAFVLGGEKLKHYLINFARSLIYTTAISPQAQERLRRITILIGEMDLERKRLWDNIDYFRKKATEAGLSINESSSAIQLFMIPGIEKAKQTAQRIQEAGMMVKAILAPTVPEGEERIRVCLHSFNTKEEIDALIQAAR